MMYTPAPFADWESERLARVIDANAFGLLINGGGERPAVTHLSFLLERDRETGDRLVCHVARANPHWRAVEAEGRALAVFAGPHAYVSPRWYRTSPAVPTWNYVAVHVAGPARTIHDPQRLRALVAGLADRHEAGRPEPWSLDAVPPQFVAAQLKGIVGIEISVERIIGKRKLSQNRSAADRAGVIAALAGETDDDARSIAAEMESDMAELSPEETRTTS